MVLAAEEPVRTRPSRRLAHLWGRAACVLTTLLVGVGTMWPAAPHLATRATGSGDGEYYLWQTWRIGELMRSPSFWWELRIPDVVAPYGVDLRLVDGLLPSLVGGAWNLVAPPVLAYNLALLTATCLNAFAAHRLAGLFTRHRAVRLVCGLAFATAPAIALRINGHYALYFAFTAPLLLAEAVQVARRPEHLRTVRIGVLLVLAYLCSAYYLVFGAMAVAVVTVPTLVHRRPRADTLRKVAVGGAVVAAGLLPFVLPRLALERAEEEAGSLAVGLTAAAHAYSADALAVAVPPATSTYALPAALDVAHQFSSNVLEATTFPGYLLLLGAGGLVLLRHPLRWRLLALAGVLWTFSLGPSLIVHGTMLFRPDETSVAPRWLPFSLLLEVPGLGALRAPNRASFVLAAALVPAAAIVLDHLFRGRGRAGRAGLVAASAVLLGTNLQLPVATATLEVDGAVERALEEVADRAGDGDTTVFVPADCYDAVTKAIKLQVFFETPALGCQASTSTIPWYSGLDRYAASESLASLRCNPGAFGRLAVAVAPDARDLAPDDLEALHREFGVRFLIYDKAVLRQPACAGLVAELPDIAGYEVLAEDDRWAVVDTRPSPP